MARAKAIACASGAPEGAANRAGGAGTCTGSGVGIGIGEMEKLGGFGTLVATGCCSRTPVLAGTGNWVAVSVG